VGTRVRLAGLDAGEVLEVGVPPTPSRPFLVRMRIRQDLRALVRTDSVCAIQTDGLVGAAFIQVSVGTDAAPIVGNGAVLAGRDPVELADVLQEGREAFQLVSREVMSLTGDVSGLVTSVTRAVDTTEVVIGRSGERIERMGQSGQQVLADVQRGVGDVQAIVARARAGEGTVGRLLTDTALYDRLRAVTDEAAGTARTLRETSEVARAAVQDFTAPGGSGVRMTETVRSTLASIEEVTSDLSEGTEALKRNFLVRGFFRRRGFFDLDAVSRDAYKAGLLERDNRTAVRIWLDGRLLFTRDDDGRERLTADGRRRLDSAMAQLVQYPRDSPLVVEGYAQATDQDANYLVSTDRATMVWDYLLGRFRRATTLTDIMPLGSEASGSPSGDDRWEGVALAMYVSNDVFREPRR
jgi:phospholipid/cholesterol/gamma-HCH transport system substrate-binding protein